MLLQYSSQKKILSKAKKLGELEKWELRGVWFSNCLIQNSFLWLKTSLLGDHPVAQPDNAEYLLNRSPPTQEACLSVNNNWFQDGITWHDTACYHKKPFICEDSDLLIRKAKALSPSVKIWSDIIIAMFY